MELIVLMAIAGLLGYAAGHEQRKPAPQPVHLAPKDPLRAWALGPGAAFLPADFLDWMIGLSDAEAAEFSAAFGKDAAAMNMSLDVLVQGQLDGRPEVRQVFVEALVIYSNAYRKLAEAKKKAKGQEAKEKEAPAQPAEEKQHAEKKPSRRKSEVTLNNAALA